MVWRLQITYERLIHEVRYKTLQDVHKDFTNCIAGVRGVPKNCPKGLYFYDP